MQNNSQNLGKLGEGIAKTHLENSGYLILESNWRFKKYEVDIIAQKENKIIIIEVKARTGNAYGEPESFVSKQKQRFLISAAHNYLIEKNIDLECRFDIISILIINNIPSVKHIESAFYPSLK
ncbi:MAG: YraN family protein [Bacteroidota bacterium]|nr:YraN family protein [Bacteroidota bacterium]